MYRQSEVRRLASLLERAESGLKVASITGPGGVGKSFLLQEVFSQQSPRDLEYMHLSVDGSNPQTRADFFGLVDGQLASRSLPPPARPEQDYFPQLRKVAAIHRELIAKTVAELDRKGVPKEVRETVVAFLRAAQVLNKVIPGKGKIRDAVLGTLDADAAGELAEAAWDALEKLSALHEKVTLPGPLQDLIGITQRNRVKQDLYNFSADALCGDLTAALSGYRRKDLWRWTQPPLEGFKKLLLVFDDFEATAPVLGDFVISALMPRLAVAPFPTVMIFASRDDLEALHPGFAQHAKRWLAETVDLKSFDRDTSIEIMRQAGIPDERHDRLFEITHGYPYLLSLMIEQATSPEADSALFARKLFDRTTRWMTEREQDWFKLLCYLDVVNEETIEAMAPDGADPGRIQEWFEREASIREPSAPVFTVRPLIREKTLQYLATRSPRRHREMLERARAASEAGSAGS